MYTILRTLVDLPGIKNKVYARNYGCYPMTREDFQVFRVQFEVLSLTFLLPETPICHLTHSILIVRSLIQISGTCKENTLLYTEEF